MTFFHKTSSTRFWIRLQRHARGQYEAVLSGLTCQDILEALPELFTGHHLVLFSPSGMLWDGELFRTHQVEHAAVDPKASESIHVIPPGSVEKLLRAEDMNQNDEWWFFPFPKAMTAEDIRLLELKPSLSTYSEGPPEALDLFVACVGDLTVYTRNPGHIRRLVQKLFTKYFVGLDLLCPEEAAQVDFAQQLEVSLEALERSPKWEADFTLVPDEVLRVFKDDARDWRRIVYEYAPETKRFERREAKHLGLLRLIAENWGTIAVDLSSVILGVGTIIILLAILGLVLAVIISAFS